MSKQKGTRTNFDFSKLIFKQKECIKCSNKFTPKSGVQIKCDNCRFNCEICGEPKSDRVTNNLCFKCGLQKRRFKRKCNTCNIIFHDKNNKSLFCEQCSLIEYPKNCIDCNVSITYGHKRCNKCQSKKRTNFGGGWRKYEHNGIRFRSSWEIEFAKILESCNIKYIYELYHKETRTRPDFYIKELDRYIEIHPDYHGIKTKIPENCVLIKTISHTRAMAFAIAFKLNKELAIKEINKLSKRAQNGLYKIMISSAIFLKQAIFERDGK